MKVLLIFYIKALIPLDCQWPINNFLNMPRVRRDQEGAPGEGERRRGGGLNISVIEDLSEDIGKTLHTKDGQVIKLP